MTTPVLLCVDDCSDDLLLFKYAADAANLTFQLQYVHSGEMAIEYLAGAGAFADRHQFPLPDYILLDLKMPGKSGFDVLNWMQSQRHLRRVCVIVFTASTHPEDRDRALQLGARDYVVKPVDFRQLQQFVLTLGGFLSGQPLAG